MSSHHLRWTYLALCLVCTSAQPLVADDEFGNPAKSPDCLCFRAAPLSQCKSFLITETGTRFYTENYRGDDGRAISLMAEMGWMKNIAPNYALGITAFHIMDVSSYRFGIRPHIRRWFGRNFNIDFAPGIILYSNEIDFQFWDQEPRYDGDGPGIAASLSFSAFDLIAITAQYEHFRYSYRSGYELLDVRAGSTDTFQATDRFSVGLTGQSYFGLPVVVLSLILAVTAVTD